LLKCKSQKLNRDYMTFSAQVMKSHNIKRADSWMATLMMATTYRE